MILDVFLPEHTKEITPVTLTEFDLSELLAACKAGEFTERIRSSLEWVLQQLIEVEATSVIGAGRYERADGRVPQRNGHRPRLLSTPAGDVELAIPKLRKGSFFPSLLERRRRVDRALYAVVMEAYVHGVSTRKVDRLPPRAACPGTQRGAAGHLGPPPRVEAGDRVGVRRRCLAAVPGALHAKRPAVSPEGFRDVVDTKLTGCFLVARAVVPKMLQAGSGRVVMVSMNTATMTRRGFAPYGPAGAGVEALTGVMAADLANTAVAVNTLLPGGATATGMVPDDIPTDLRVQLLDPAIMGPPIVWLASPHAACVTGERIIATEFDDWLARRTP